MKHKVEREYERIEMSLNQGEIIPYKELMAMTFLYQRIKLSVPISFIAAMISSLFLDNLFTEGLPAYLTHLMLFIINFITIHIINRQGLKKLKLDWVTNPRIVEELIKQFQSNSSFDSTHFGTMLFKMSQLRPLLEYELDWFIMKLTQLNNIEQEQYQLEGVIKHGYVNSDVELTIAKKAQYAAMWEYKKSILNGTSLENPFVNNLKQDFEDGLLIAKNSNLNLISDLRIDIDKLKKFD